jgi:glycosyltransferase involved in cell wall biosynthesis
MAVGCPVIATYVGGISEVIENRKTGLLIPPSSPKAIKEAVLELISSPSLQKEMAINAQAVIRNRFSLERMVDRYQCLYSRAMQSAGNAGTLFLKANR